MIFLFHARHEPASMRIEAASFEEAEIAATDALPVGHYLVGVDGDGDVTGFLMNENGSTRLSVVDVRNYAIVPKSSRAH